MWLGSPLEIFVRSDLTPGISVGIVELVAVGRDPAYFESGKKTQTHSSLPFVSGVRVRGSGTILCGAEHSEPLSSSLHYQNSWQNQVLD